MTWCDRLELGLAMARHGKEITGRDDSERIRTLAQCLYAGAMAWCWRNGLVLARCFKLLATRMKHG